MNRETVFIAFVVICGLSLYGGAVAIGASMDVPGDGDSERDPFELVDREESETDESNDERTVFEFDTAFNFTEVSDETGLNYSYETTASGTTNQMMSNAGVYVADYNRDGWEDILLTGGPEPALFENTGGEFERTGALSDVDRDVRAALWVDYDRDGWEDLLLLSNGHAPLLLTNENGSFERSETFSHSLEMPIGATTADFTGNGCPDLLVIQNGNWSDELPVGQQNYSATLETDNGNRDWLYVGDCSGFERTNRMAFNGTRWSLATSSTDLTGNGHPDIYVAHDFGHDTLYRNDGTGHFERQILGERTNRNGMSAEITDFNRDHRPDVFVTNIYYPNWAAKIINNVLQTKASGNNALINTGNGTFEERGKTLGVNAGGWGWAAIAADLNHDGRRDLFHTTRVMTFESRDVRLSDRQIDRLRDREFYSGPALWVGERDGSYRNVSSLLNGFHSANGRGTARIDYDRDGDLDIVVATTEEYKLYRNGENGHDEDDQTALQVDVRADWGGPAYGADVYVTANDTEQWRRVHSRTDFLSQEPRIVHFGVGSADRVDVRVVWPDGTERTFERVRSGTRIVVSPEGEPERTLLNGTSTSGRSAD